VQLVHSARERLKKRSRAIFPVVEAVSTDFSVENDTFSSEPPRKRARKATQLPQFDVYQDKKLRTNSPEVCGFKSPTPGLIKRQTEKIWPHISVNIPFRPEFHQYSLESSSTHANRKPLAPLSLIALNRDQKAPKIPQNWLKNQPNDHTSTFFTLFYYFFVLFLFFTLLNN
jgi:hypothetical protein